MTLDPKLLIRLNTSGRPLQNCAEASTHAWRKLPRYTADVTDRIVSLAARLSTSPLGVISNVQDVRNSNTWTVWKESEGCVTYSAAPYTTLLLTCTLPSPAGQSKSRSGSR